MVEIVQVENLQVDAPDPVVRERVRAVDHLGRGAGQPVRTQFAGVTPDSGGATGVLRPPKRAEATVTVPSSARKYQRLSWSVLMG